MGEGKLFLDDGKSSRKTGSELVDNAYWLCSRCAGKYTINFTETGAMLVSTETGREELVA
jgi:hypothetical protein